MLDSYITSVTQHFVKNSIAQKLMGEATRWFVLVERQCNSLVLKSATNAFRNGTIAINVSLIQSELAFRSYILTELPVYLFFLKINKI